MQGRSANTALVMRTEIPTQLVSQSQGTALTAGTLKQWLAKNATRPYLNRLRGRWARPWHSMLKEKVEASVALLGSRPEMNEKELPTSPAEELRWHSASKVGGVE